MWGKVVSFGWLEQFQEWLDCTACFCKGCMNESVGEGQGCAGHFQKTPYSLSRFVIFDSLLWVSSNTRKDSALGCVRRKVLWFPYSASSMRYPKCNKAPRVKKRQALSPFSIISSLSGVAKQGDSFFKPSCSSNSEGVGKPFLLMKGWKQKHISANIEKQCQMIIFVVLFLFVSF